MRGSSDTATNLLYGSRRTGTADNQRQREDADRKRHQRRHELYLNLPEISRSLTARLNRSGYVADTLDTQKLIDAIYEYDGNEERIFDYLIRSNLVEARDPNKIYS